MFFNWLKEKLSVSEDEITGTDKSKISIRSDSGKTNIDKTTVDYIINKYKKEANKFLNTYYEENETLKDILDIQIKSDLLSFVNILFSIINDDYFIGHKILRTKIERIDSYVFSQYRKEPDLKQNIYKLLIFVQNSKFSSNVRENLLEYVNLLNYTGVNIFGLLQDYYKYLEELEKNHKIIDYLNKKNNFDNHISYINESSLNSLLKRIV